MEAERPEPFAGFVHLAPQIIAGEADVLSAQRRDMGKQFVRHLDTAGAQMPDGAVEIDRVPKGDGRVRRVSPEARWRWFRMCGHAVCGGG